MSAAPRLCSHCFFAVKSTPGSNLTRCPRCKKPLRRSSGDSSRPPATSARRTATAPVGPHSPPPLPTPTPPPLTCPAPSAVATAEGAEASDFQGDFPLVQPVTRPAERHPVGHPRRRRLQGRSAMVVAGVLAVGIVGAALALILVYSEPEPPAATAAFAADRPVEPARPPARPASRPTVPIPVLLSPEAERERAIRGIFQGNAVDAGLITEGASRIDELVFGKLKEKGITPAPPCSDGVFVRRVYLDVIGTLPTAREAKTFLDDRSANKRQVLIERLLQRREYAEYWGMKWADLLRVKSEFPINLWPNGVQAYDRWIRASLRENLPYDQFARALLTSSGSNFRTPPVNFYRAVQKKDPPNIAHAVALTFLGVRPEAWPKARWTGMATFFTQVAYKPTREWKEEIVYFDPGKPLNPAEAIFPDGTPATIPLDTDPRTVFADWLITPKNPWFARNITNRVWSWLMGRGIIHEPDDIRENNPPSHPELLAYLEQELIDARWDLKHLFRLILNSRAYQLSSVSAVTHPEGEALFAFHPIRRLEAEVLIDAICQITGTTESYSSPIPEPFTYIPTEHRSIRLADASITSPFLEMFGRPPRDTGLESERNNRFTPAQSLHLLNSTHIVRKIEEGPGLQGLIGPGRKLQDVLEELYLTILSRYPTEEERNTVTEYAQMGAWGRKPGADIAWALINSAEFLCRH